jgi:hypothetical protein
MGDMKKNRCLLSWCLAGAALVVVTISGCQTNVAGMTLPSPHYLDHPPQFIPESPPFPLTKELARQEQTDLAPAPGADGLPPQVPPGGLR